MKLRQILGLVLLNAGLVTASLAAVDPVETALDARIKRVPYSKDDIVELTTHYYRYTMVEFAEHERYLDHYLGDHAAWDIFSPEGQPNKLFIKPLLNKPRPDTNLIVFTDKRTYLLNILGQLKQEKRAKGNTFTYALRYEYPRERMLASQRKADAISLLENQTIIPGHKIDPSLMNSHYTFKGDKALAPVQVFDDGAFTYFQFDKDKPIPAVFFVDKSASGNGKEQIINGHQEGDYFVVQRVAEQFSLRLGKSLVCVFNKGMNDQ